MMKTLKQYLSVFAIVVSQWPAVNAQTPQQMNYQAVARNANGNALPNQHIAIRFSIHDGSVGGTVAYEETDTATTNQFGLFTTIVGAGTAITGTISGINWAGGSKYLQVELDAAGGSAFTDMGTTQLLSVPYALFAANTNGGWSLSGNNGTNTSTNFLGTTDSAAIAFRTNNTEAMRLQTDGRLYLFNSLSNTMVGDSTGMATTGQGGYNNAFFGQAAGYANTIGAGNAYHGYHAGYSNEAGNANTAMGYRALQANVGYGGNTAIGFKALLQDSTGYNNTAIGTSAMTNNLTGTYNTAVGMDALTFNTTGNANTAVGIYSALYNTTGSGNVALGFSAGGLNYTGSSNVAIGNYALYFNQNGSNLVAIGDSALYNQTTGNLNNTAVGSKTLFSNTSGGANIAMGSFALFSNDSGAGNSALGYASLYSNTTGSYNTALGQEALYGSFISRGNLNTAVGYQALFYIQAGDNNTALGADALFGNTDGSGNTAMGYYTMYNNTSGHENVALGINVMHENDLGYYNTGAGNGAMYFNTSGNGNTAIGSYTLYINTTGSFNTCLGYAATVSAAALTNISAFGGYAQATASNQVRIGNNAVTSIGGYTNWSNISDGRFKTDINDKVVGLDFIKQLRPVTYRLNLRRLDEFTYGDKATEYEKNIADGIAEKEKIIYSGFVAQEVEEAAKATGYNFSGIIRPQNNKDNYAISYADFVVPLVKGMQEQQKMIEELKKQNELQQKEIEELKTKRAISH